MHYSKKEAALRLNFLKHFTQRYILKSFIKHDPNGSEEIETVTKDG